ncbi:hypothetical protein [Streptomyces griseocarneus]|uniref:hypothetical protein n=1 Tax=Streptomyces griseocarneus TaxID=51201 RepID=UPI00167CD2F1|nr:hypothetical protein [Streptomyces griseocarneus]MBZ6472489.1 hypothetical protein [Streptomyces griseocarneus]GHG45483.1 hypothetical protein GCM10018779_01420 [Streptomyces griseocarneus]
MSEYRTRYYRGWGVDASGEVSPEEFVELAESSLAYFDSAGRLERLEFFRDGAVEEVEYCEGDPGEIAESHRRKHVGVPFSVKRTLAADPFRWEVRRRSSAEGGFSDYRVSLVDVRGCELMECAFGVQGQILSVTKYEYDRAGEMRFTFEYDGMGQMVDAFDVISGENAAFDVVKNLTDPEFFERGGALPRECVATSIPSPVEVFREGA